MSGMYHAGVFSCVLMSQACQEQRPRALPVAGSAALRHPAACPPVPGSSIPGAARASLLQSGGTLSPSLKGVWGPGRGAELQGARHGDAGHRGRQAGPGGARGRLLGWLAASAGVAPSLAACSRLRPSCRRSGTVRGGEVWGRAGCLGWSAGTWSCQRPPLMAALPVPLQEAQVPRSTTQCGAGACWSLQGAWASGWGSLGISWGAVLGHRSPAAPSASFPPVQAPAWVPLLGAPPCPQMASRAGEGWAGQGRAHPVGAMTCPMAWRAHRRGGGCFPYR